MESIVSNSQNLIISQAEISLSIVRFLRGALIGRPQVLTAREYDSSINFPKKIIYRFNILINDQKWDFKSDFIWNN